MVGRCRSACWWGAVSREEPTEDIFVSILSVCLISSSPPQSEVMQQEGLISTPSTSIALYFQLNCSLSNKYFGTNVKLIHSFNKYALSINYKPCTREFPGGLVVRTPSFHYKGNRFDPWICELRSCMTCDPLQKCPCISLDAGDITVGAKQKFCRQEFTSC